MPTIDMSDFASLLRRYRRRSGLTQEELAERAGLSAASISLLERGITRAPQRATVNMLSVALALSPEEAAVFVEQAHSTRKLDSDDNAPAPAAVMQGENLPIPLTSLIGRERERAILLAMLGRDTTRLLTLIGPAGVGKTRLALELAATLRHEQCQDVIFVGLTPVLEPERVLPAIAQAMNIRESDSLPLREALIHVLRGRAVVLLLDNFEQVLPAARGVLELLIACPRMKALVTSRSPLNVRGEQCFPVSPLAQPNPAQLNSIEELRRAPTVELFLERATAAWPDLRVTTLEDGYLVAGICERLDGLPLAIELAAARIRHFGLRQLHDRLTEPTFLGVLAEGAQDLADHQRTMRLTIAWSYELLSDEEKRLFRWLGVFVGGVTSEAAKAVTGVTDDALIASMTALINASLAHYTDTTGTRRYTQLVTLQAYAQERLRADGEWEEVRRRHADYFLKVVELTLPDQVDQPLEIMAQIEIAYENIRLALTWAWETDETMRGLRMAAALRRFWVSHSQYLEGLDWLERFIKRAGMPTNQEEQASLAGAWTGVLMITHRLDRLERARDAGEIALALRRELGDKTQIARAMMNLASPLIQLRDYERGWSLYEESLTLHRDTGNRRAQILPLMNLGGLYHELGKPREALAHYEESLAISREVGETDWARALTWNNIGEVYIALDEPLRAIEVTEPSYHLFTREHDIFGAAICAFTLGRAQWRAGDAEAGRAYLGEAECLFRNLGNPAMAARILYFRASFALEAHHIAQARQDLAQALDDLSGQIRAKEYIWWLAERAGTLARCYCEPEMSARLCAAGISHRDAFPTPLEPVERELRARDRNWLCATLGEAAFTNAITEGQTLSLDNAAAALAQALHSDQSSQ